DLMRRRLLVGAACRQFVVDEFFELRSRLRPRQRPPVNKKRWRAVYTRFFAGRLVALYLAFVFRLVEARVELGGIQSERLGSRLQIGRRQLALIGEQRVSKLPELVLFVGASRGLRGVKRVRMERQREVHVYEANFVPIFRLQLLQRAFRFLAERALKVGELDDGDGRIFAAARRMAAAVHHDTLGLEQNLHRRLLAQASQQRLA